MNNIWMKDNKTLEDWLWCLNDVINKGHYFEISDESAKELKVCIENLIKENKKLQDLLKYYDITRRLRMQEVKRYYENKYKKEVQ